MISTLFRDTRRSTHSNRLRIKFYVPFFILWCQTNFYVTYDVDGCLLLSLQRSHLFSIFLSNSRLITLFHRCNNTLRVFSSDLIWTDLIWDYYTADITNSALFS